MGHDCRFFSRQIRSDSSKLSPSCAFRTHRRHLTAECCDLLFSWIVDNILCYKMTISQNLVTNFVTLVWQYLLACKCTNLGLYWDNSAFGIGHAMTKMHRLGFWNMVNFVGFSVIHVLRNCVATCIRYGGISTQCCIANILLSLPVKDFYKSVKIWQSLGAWFFEHRVDLAPYPHITGSAHTQPQTLQVKQNLPNFITEKK